VQSKFPYWWHPAASLRRQDAADTNHVTSFYTPCLPGEMSKRKKQPLPPRVKRMNRRKRLQTAKNWIGSYEGKNLLRGYCKHFAVDWRCAAVELKLLGVVLDPGYLKRRKNSEPEKLAERRAKKEKRTEVENSDRWHDHDSLLGAYMAGDYEALFAMECERDGIDPITLRPLNEDNSSNQIDEDNVPF
jgi:hypothetical protein